MSDTSVYNRVHDGGRIHVESLRELLLLIIDLISKAEYKAPSLTRTLKLKLSAANWSAISWEEPDGTVQADGVAVLKFAALKYCLATGRGNSTEHTDRPSLMLHEIFDPQGEYFRIIDTPEGQKIIGTDALEEKHGLIVDVPLSGPLYEDDEDF